MDPSVFFGRSRVTRQTLKPKQQILQTDIVNCEVKDTKTSRKTRATPAAPASKKNASETTKRKGTATKNAEESTGKRGKKPTVDDDRKIAPKPSRNDHKVHFEEQENVMQETTRSGPVYKDVKRSDIVGNPFEEYEFDFDENNAPQMKKKSRKTRTAKPTKDVKSWQGIVKWDPSKRPILGSKLSKSKPAKKQKPSYLPAGQEATSSCAKSHSVQNQKIILSSKPKVPVDGKKEAQSSQVNHFKSHTTSSQSQSIPNNLMMAANGTSHQSQMKTHISSTPVKTPNHGSMKSVALPALTPISTAPKLSLTSRPKPSSSVTAERRKCDFVSDVSSILRSPIPEITEDLVSSPGTEAVPGDAPNHNETGKVPGNQAGRSVASNPARVSSLAASTSGGNARPRPANVSATFSSIPIIHVRESPSFKETVSSPHVPEDSSSHLTAADCCMINTNAVTSTPEARSKVVANCNSSVASTRNFDVSSSSPSQAACSPVALSTTPARLSCSEADDDDDGNMSRLFDDLPRTSVIPTRMFSTHRGTLFVPEAEKNKRKLPTLSPNKEQSISRATAVKFSDPQPSFDVHDCFGFANDDSVFLPQRANNAAHATRSQTAKESKTAVPKPSIQQVQALLRGQLRLPSPTCSPRSIQTKLTDFVNSTPTSPPVRSVHQSKSAVITPTPVPLFGEEDLDKEIGSPFLQPSRRSYDRLRPTKRIACGDEVLSDHEEEDLTNGHLQKPVDPETKKKNRSYKKKKKPQNPQLDEWANQIKSHFEEVEKIELQVE